MKELIKRIENSELKSNVESVKTSVEDLVANYEKLTDMLENKDNLSKEDLLYQLSELKESLGFVENDIIELKDTVEELE